MSRTNILLFLCAALSIPAAAQTREGYLKAYEERAQFVLSAYDTSTGSYYAAAVRYAQNRDIAVADSIFTALLREPRGDMFWMFPVIGTYMHGKDRMSPAGLMIHEPRELILRRYYYPLGNL